jgi:hypothetical protein
VHPKIQRREASQVTLEMERLGLRSDEFDQTVAAVYDRRAFAELVRNPSAVIDRRYSLNVL